MLQKATREVNKMKKAMCLEAPSHPYSTLGITRLLGAPGLWHARAPRAPDFCIASAVPSWKQRVMAGGFGAGEVATRDVNELGSDVICDMRENCDVIVLNFYIFVVYDSAMLENGNSGHDFDPTQVLLCEASVVHISEDISKVGGPLALEEVV